jgi:hypothetical protein
MILNWILDRMGWNGWTDLAQESGQWGPLVNTVMNLRVPESVGKFLSGSATYGFSRRAQLHGVCTLLKICIFYWKYFDIINV